MADNGNNGIMRELTESSLSKNVNLVGLFESSLVPCESPNGSKLSHDGDEDSYATDLSQVIDLFNIQRQKQQSLEQDVLKLQARAESAEARLSSLEASKSDNEFEVGKQAPKVLTECDDAQMDLGSEVLERLANLDLGSGKLEDELFDTRQNVATLKAQLDSVERARAWRVPTGNALEEQLADLMEYEWETSVYDGLLFVWMDSLGLGHMQSFLVILGFCMNAFMAIVTFTVVGGNDFLDADKLSAEAARLWRLWDGNNLDSVDMFTKMTLATRVCNEDKTLSFATYHRDLKEEIARYSDSDGWLLCTVAILLWSSCCAGEVRQAMRFAAALINFPRAAHTTFEYQEDGRIQVAGLGLCRLVLGMIITTIRITFAIILMYQGSAWLARTISIENLLLNASALGFVLEIDNVLFGVVAPLRVISTIKNLVPGTVSAKRSVLTFLPLIMMCLIVACTVWTHLVELNEMQDQMDTWDRIACQPTNTLKYSISRSALGWVTYTNKTADWGNQDDQFVSMTPMQKKIVEDLIRDDETAKKHALFVDDLNHQRFLQLADMEGLANHHYCTDENTIKKGSTLGNRLAAASGHHEFDNVKSCEEIKDRCYDTDENNEKIGNNIRFMCPLTCGCSDRLAGLWDLGRAKKGCPQFHCQKKLVNALKKDLPCTDIPVTSLTTMSGWQLLVKRLNVTQTCKIEEIRNLTVLGCGALKYLNPSRRVLDVCTMNEVINQGMAPFCPESCQCSRAEDIGAKLPCPGLCPQSCCVR